MNFYWDESHVQSAEDINSFLPLLSTSNEGIAKLQLLEVGVPPEFIF